jgi:polyisoprenoid-binding protein YceI
MSTATATSTRTTWKIDPSHSHVEFSVRHLMISSVKGRFGALDGSVVTDEAAPAKVDVTVSIDAASLDTREAQRDTHLRSADFFDVEKFPTLTFQGGRVSGSTTDSFKLTGDLTIHGVTREVTLDVVSEGRGKDPWGGDRAGYSATTKIKRSDFGLTWNQLLEAGGIAVGDEIKISIDVELVKQ